MWRKRGRVGEVQCLICEVKRELGFSLVCHWVGSYILSGTRCGFQRLRVRCMVPYPRGSHLEPKANAGPGSDRPW